MYLRLIWSSPDKFRIKELVNENKNHTKDLKPPVCSSEKYLINSILEICYSKSKRDEYLVEYSKMG